MVFFIPPISSRTKLAAFSALLSDAGTGGIFFWSSLGSCSRRALTSVPLVGGKWGKGWEIPGKPGGKGWIWTFGKKLEKRCDTEKHWRDINVFLDRWYGWYGNVHANIDTVLWSCGFSVFFTKIQHHVRLKFHNLDHWRPSKRSILSKPPSISISCSAFFTPMLNELSFMYPLVIWCSYGKPPILVGKSS